ncbi:glycine zipper 2TM domain-containing protein [Massilia glaciei]|uniref:Glycine zipper 2TM domain-containing protein n=1 Tax=Massilia glaciei TaxID=1524097 RepID=A0A2U2HC73_9BURK|nr:glycine zipper 2TM domain-containing protein [Massilia glaciei]PWF40549.1 glycine zipper 2TM domain-containing protein [Massilia glaciei]
MNIQAKLIITAIGIGLLPAAQAAEFADYGRVLRVEPRTERYSQPREECRTEYVQAPVQQQQPQRSAGGAIIGGLTGAILGNQVGGGSGRAAATAAGAIAGAMVGDNIDNRGRAAPGGYQPQYQEQAVRQCRMVDSYESRTVGYDVTYDYRGQTYTTTMPRDPGKRVRLLVSMEPDPRQY